MKKYFPVLAVVIICLLVLSSCAPEAPTVKEYGFFYGILHGFLFLFAIIGKLFGVDTGLYALHNTGFFYWLGYLIGVLVFGGGGYKSGKRFS